GYLETILTVKNLDPEKEKYFLNRCYSQSTRLADLLHDISVLNRLSEAGSLFELKETDICELIDDIERTCSPEMEKKHITFTKNLANHPIIKGNYSLLYSIFRNLMDNAIAYAGTGIQISVSCYKEDPNFYYFSFEDNGVGIPSKHVNRIFERFYRVDKGRSRKMGGTGLGLSIVKNAVKFHKGRISVKSELDKRTIFFFTLKKYISIKETKTEA
ncbi:MAG: ATP-binding protein, partial [Massilibacteroides sp.]|nr:ATP-binding protein [Massilibacteroides sp.]